MRVWKFIKREKRQPDAIKPAGWYLAWQTTCTSTDKWKNSLILHKIYKTVQINYHTISDPVAEDLCELRVYYNQTRGDSGKVVLEFLLFCLYQVWIKCCFDDNIVFMLQYTMYNEEHCQQFALHVTRQSCAQSACPHHTLMTRILHFLLCLTSSGYCNNYSNGRGSKMKNYMESIKGGKWGGCQGNTSKGLSHRGPLLTYFIM